MPFYVSPVRAESIALDRDSLNSIEFKRIKPNRYFHGDGLLQIEVDQSASFMLYAFDTLRTVRRVAFQWRSCGELKQLDADYEATKDGDDAWLRIGLVLKGESQFLNPLAPKWVKQVRDTLRYPGGGMIYLIAGAQHAPGESWQSPYTDDVTMIAVSNRTAVNGWKQAEHRFDEPVEVVGLWIMADGDNTRSTFTTQLKSLVVE